MFWFNMNILLCINRKCIYGVNMIILLYILSLYMSTDVNVILYKTFLVFAFYLWWQVISIMMMMTITVLANMEKYMHLQCNASKLSMHLNFYPYHNVFTFLLRNYFLKIKIFFLISEYWKKFTAFACPKHV